MMNRKQEIFAVLVAICLAPSANSQQVPNQVISLLKNSLAAQSGNSVIRDVTLTGLAESIAGSEDETVPFNFQAISSGSDRTELNLPSGQRTEIRQNATSGLSGAWSNGDGKQHAIAGHNLLTGSAWYFPIFVVQRLLSDPNVAVSFVGLENGVGHFQATVNPPANLSANASTQIQRWSKIDLYLDSTSLLPKRLSFNVHPDDNAFIDIPVSVQFSNYQQVNGATVPMHIQRYVNDVLALDVQVQAVSFNTGLLPSSFNTH